MSIWNKPVAEITFQDVEDFCQHKHKEGPRLDYKREFNESHHKLICAFANTLGGTIILGVDSDANNEPLWPPHGLTNSAGLEDRIIQVCQDTIYPPVRPHVSRLMTDQASGKSVLVVRVDESPEAPHAVDNGREVYVYERTGSINKPWKLAQIDRIEQLLKRRNRYEEDRESYIKKAIERGRRYFNAPALAVRWASIIPLYPWRKLCDPVLCYDLHRGQKYGRVQRFPNGSFALRGDPDPTAVEIMTAYGHIFVMEYPQESKKNPIAEGNGVAPNDFLLWARTLALINTTIFNLAKQFFGLQSVQLPGLLQFDVGFLNAFGKQMVKSENAGTYQVGRPFPDSEFRTQVIFPVENLANRNSAHEQHLFHEIGYGFDLFDNTQQI